MQETTKLNFQLINVMICDLFLNKTVTLKYYLQSAEVDSVIIEYLITANVY